MKLEELYEKLDGAIDGFTPAIVQLENIETRERIDKFVMVQDGTVQQVFGTTQRVLDVIDLTDDELVHYITEWTKACGDSLAEGGYRTSDTTAREES